MPCHQARIVLIVFFTFFAGLAHAVPVGDLVTVRDTPRPGSDEAYRKTYKTLVWTPNERAVIQSQLAKIYRRAPGLLIRGAGEGTISLYRAHINTYAKGGPRLVVLSKDHFTYPDYSIRVLFHEMVHTADAYNRLSGSEAFKAIFVPKIKQARALLAQEGLTPASAAALPLDARRQKIERAVRRQTGLPSAYAARNLAECLAETISFWLTPEYRYTPPASAIDLLTPFISANSVPNPLDADYRQALVLAYAGKSDAAAAKLTQIIARDPQFYQAFSTRGYIHLKAKDFARAVQDLKQARDLISPYQTGYGFYDSEWKRVSALAKAPR